jgi:hypothetical protein
MGAMPTRPDRRGSPAVAALLAAAALAPAPAAAECTPGAVLPLFDLGTPLEDLARLAQLTGTAPLAPDLIRAGGRREVVLCAEGPPLPWSRAAAPVAGDRWVAPLPLLVRAVENTRYPDGGNDGLLWAGRGVSAVATGGLAFRLGPLSGALAPSVAWQQNAWFRTVPTGQPGRLGLADPWYGSAIDRPQRFGRGPFGAAGLGQSGLRLDALGVALGISAENRWLGPGRRHALLLTNSAPGFPHLFVGTSRPVDAWIGHVEALAFWGRLTRSGTFQLPGSHAFATGLSVDLQPAPVPGLFLGVSRVFVTPWQDRSLGGAFPFLDALWKRDTGDDPRDNQLTSLHWRWVFRESEAEIYGEWGREDGAYSPDIFLREPSWSQAWLVGLQKVFRRPERWVRAQLELLHLLDATPPQSRRGIIAWYTHPENLSWTERGQPLGSWVGPGGDAQSLAVDVFTPRGRWGLSLERVGRNRAAYYVSVEPAGGNPDVEVTLRLRGVVLAGPVDVAWEVAGNWRYFRDFLKVEPGLQARLELVLPLPDLRGRP